MEIKRRREKEKRERERERERERREGERQRQSQRQREVAGGDSWADGPGMAEDVLLSLFIVTFVMVVCWVMLQITIVVLLDRFYAYACICHWEICPCL